MGEEINTANWFLRSPCTPDSTAAKALERERALRSQAAKGEALNPDVALMLELLSLDRMDWERNINEARAVVKILRAQLATIERETLERAAKVADGFHTHSCDMAAAKIRALAQKPEASGEKEP